MRDDVTPPNFGNAPKDYDKYFFYQSYRSIEIFLANLLAKGPAVFSKITVDDFVVTGNITMTGTVTASGFTGDTFTGGTFSGTAFTGGTFSGTFSGDGSGLTSLNATKLTGVVPMANGGTGGVGNGMVAITAAATLSPRTITGTASKVTVTNGDGVAGNPTLTLPDALALVTPTVSGLLTVSGGQIKFPSTAIPSTDPNTLDDYEEGSFTPTVTFNGSSTGVTYSLQTGRYVRIGSVVYAMIYLSVTNKGTSTGTFNIHGLPFNQASGQYAPFACGYYTGFVSLSGAPLGYLESSNNFLNMNKPGSTNHSSMSSSDVNTAFSLILTLTYQAA